MYSSHLSGHFSWMRKFLAASLMVLMDLSACPFPHGEPTEVGKYFIPIGFR